ALPTRARGRVVADRRAAALLPRHRHVDRARALPRDRRLRALREPTQAQLLARPRARSRPIRREPPPGRDHQDRLELRAPAARRGRLALPARAANRDNGRQPPTRTAGARAPDRLARPAPAPPPPHPPAC